MKRTLSLVLLICSCAVAIARAQTYAVHGVRDVRYLDDEDWRRDQNVEVAAAMKAAGHTRVEIAMIRDRTHGTIRSRLGSEGDDTAEQIIRFVSR
jgi:Ni/Co efflux regulator RcnB